MALIRYVTHAEVAVDPAIAVPAWSLSERGRARVVAMLGQPWLARVGRVVTSPETKAVETATILADHLGLALEMRPDTGEIDRTSTGFVPHERHEALSDLLFAHPDESAEGWERAIDAQARIVAALDDLLTGSAVPAGTRDADVIVVGHGGVGTLWCCALAGWPIDRRRDQPGQGHYATVDAATRTLVHGWQRIDDVQPG